jgi:archaemetzincin
MNPANRIIGVVPIGDVHALAPKIIAAHISGYFKLAVDILDPLPPPVCALDEIQGQYNAAKILALFESGSYESFDKVIGVLNTDLFIPTFSYVFGEARLGGKYALVSLFRLTEEKKYTNPPSAVHCERAAKVAIHELGHLYELSHCEDKRCLMHYAGGIEDLDSTPLYFCRYCHTYFREALEGS